MLVVDASVIGSLLLPDEPELADATAQAMGLGPLLAPAHWPLEVVNALHMAERRRRITRPARQEAIAQARSLPVLIQLDTAEQAWTETSRLADLHGLTVYDAAYLELAIRTGASLATRDGDLMRAAHAENVPVLT